MRKKYTYHFGLAIVMPLIVSIGNVNAASCYGDAAGYCLVNGNSSFSVDSFGIMEVTLNNRTNFYTTDFLIDKPVIQSGSQDTKGASLKSKGRNNKTKNVKSTATKDIPALSFIDYMDLNNVVQSVDTLTMSNLALSNWNLSVDLSFKLVGGEIGSEYTSLIETFTITNISGQAISDLSLMAFNDIDLGGVLSAGNDQGAISSTDSSGNPLAYTQWDSVDQLVSRFSVAPDHYEVALADDPGNDLATKVYGDNTAILSDTVYDLSPANLSMALQWQRSLADGESFSYTKTMQLNPVPLPAAVWLFGSGLIGLMFFAKGRNKLIN